MTDYPVIFSAAMVRALLAGRKTMTRRLAWKTLTEDIGFTDAPELFMSSAMLRRSWRYSSNSKSVTAEIPSPWQKVKAGDRLYVREAWRACTRRERLRPSEIAALQHPGPIWYEAGYWDPGFKKVIHFQGADLDAQWIKGKLQPSIHLPRALSRLTLIVTATKIERLQDISAADSIAEGVECETCVAMGTSACNRKGCFASLSVFRALWESLHGVGSFETSGEVVALTFRVIQQNIDRIKEAA